MTRVKPPRYINKQDITTAADRLLDRMRESGFTPKWPQLADLVTDFLDLSIIWESFDPLEDGVIAAKILPSKSEIYINDAFQAIHDNHGLYESTLAHEIGHWMLHIDRDEPGHPGLGVTVGNDLVKIESPETSLGEEIFLCRNLDKKISDALHQKTPDDWREWQAQYFASCLLMPLAKIEEVRQGRNLTNWNHVNAIADELGVTKSNLVNRLQDLEYLEKSNSSSRLYLGKRSRK